MAIIDVQPLTTARKDAIANLKSSGAPGRLRHNLINVDCFIYIHYAAPSYMAGIVILGTVTVYGR